MTIIVPTPAHPLTTIGNAPDLVWFQFWSAMAAGINGGSGFLPLVASTVDATPTRLVVRQNVASVGSKSNPLLLSANSAGLLTGQCLAFAPRSGAWGMWNVQTLATRGAVVGSTALGFSTGGGAPAQTSGGSSWALALTADVILGAVAATVTGAAATTIDWLLFGSFVSLT